ncbi:ATP-dependent DNA helicase [Corynebacterium sp. MSK008]|uniref:ATP-dependent DNA helicase n=1 Tax=Corynebacterium sp. MSK008 TaxID=3050188 RepID=UPI00254ADF65|nr:ATP-dependent DNA helicase [Corynebacterium sp. MSK008]MDK8879896.1 ATP-dependent DNA helicase [Corynebacterium sp. MSK008]
MTSTRPSPVPPTVLEPKAYLVPRTRPNTQREWPVELPQEGLYKVTGEPGSGVSSFLLDTAAAAMRRRADSKAEHGPGGVLVLTDSKETGARLRAELADTLAASGFVSDEPVVRSVHSLAFALVRQQTDEELRLISGAEQDAVIRQLLQGHAEDGGGTWPAELRPALPMVGFARQLRDFLLRAIERGLGPEDLVELGQRHDIGIWSASGDFLLEYQQVMALSGAHRLSASELIAAALEVELPRTWHTVIVDDAQHLAPASAALVQRLLEQADLGVVGGDLEQSVFHFRGASPAFFKDLGGLDHEVIDLGATRRTPARSAAIADSSAAELSLVADTLRRAHLEEGVAYRDMAVVVRSTPLLEPMRRALLRAGVPVSLNPTDLVLGEQRIVSALLLGVRALYEELSATEWRDLLLSPVGGADPVTLRRLLRGLRRWSPETRAEESLRELLATPVGLPDFGTVLTDRELDILHRVRDVLDAGRSVLADGGTVEEVLWALWHATGLSNRLLASALRGGATGSQADRDLDAVMALFDAAGDHTERRPSAGIESFVASITEQELPTGVRDRRNATPDAAALLTAHGAVGREFRRVVVAGVQELTWPSLGETGSLFRQEDLVDLIDKDVDPGVPVSHINERLVEERRLFTVATSRATEQLLVTAVESDDGEEVEQRSRFVEEFCRDFDVQPRSVRIAGTSADAARIAAQPAVGAEVDSAVVRVLAHDDLIAEFRRVLVDPASTEAQCSQASRQLARLAAAGVLGADPEQWWTTTEPSTSEPLDVSPALSPSRVEKLLACPMQAVLERMSGLDETLDMIYGSMAHAYFEALGNGMDDTEALDATVAARRAADNAPEWKVERDIADFQAMLERTHGWLQASRGAFEQVAVEADVNVQVSDNVRIRGRLDRLERDSSGAVHIVDLKTGAYPPTVDATADNPQLATYQLALAHGELAGGKVVTARDGAHALSVGGAVLVYPNANKTTLSTREQAAKTAEELDALAAALDGLPEETAGPTLLAVVGPQCDRCAVRALCPVQPEGATIHHV